MSPRRSGLGAFPLLKSCLFYGAGARYAGFWRRVTYFLETFWNCLLLTSGVPRAWTLAIRPPRVDRLVLPTATLPLLPRLEMPMRVPPFLPRVALGLVLIVGDFSGSGRKSTLVGLVASGAAADCPSRLLGAKPRDQPVSSPDPWGQCKIAW